MYEPCNMVLLHDHLEVQNKIQDHCKSELFVMDLKHWDPNVYNIKPLLWEGSYAYGELATVI